MDKKLNREILEMCIDRNELDMFLGGRGVYSLGENQFAPGNSMLNLNTAMSEIYMYHREKPNKNIDLELEKTLLEWLTWKSGIGVFAVFSVLSYQLKMEQKNRSPFNLDKKKLVNKLNDSIKIYKEKLKNIKKYEGENLNHGLWEAMNIENDSNVKNYGINILNA